MTYVSTLIRSRLTADCVVDNASGDWMREHTEERLFVLAADTHASHYIHMQVCTLTDAALPCKMLLCKLTRAIICCVPIQCSACTSINTGKHMHTNRSMDSICTDNNSCLSLSIQGNRPFFSFFFFLPITNCEMLWQPLQTVIKLY